MRIYFIPCYFLANVYGFLINSHCFLSQRHQFEIIYSN